MKKPYLLMLFLIFLVSLFSSSALLTCDIKGVCDSGEVEMLELTATPNAHVADPSFDSYPYSICCSGVPGLGTDNSGETFLRLSGPNNAHVEISTNNNYPVLVNISPSQVSCNYRSGSCASDYTCLASISSSTNAVVGECDPGPFDYDTQVCCKCDATIKGYVSDEEGFLDGVKVELFYGLNMIAEYPSTAAGGYYEMDVPCGTYSLVASKEDYVVSTVTDVSLGLTAETEINITMTYGLVCEADCTYLLDDRCHEECDGFTDGGDSCQFYDNIAKTKCDLAQSGWQVEYDSDNIVRCCEGTPGAVTQIDTVINCPYKNLVKFYRIVTYQGKPIKMVTVVCGD